MVEVSKIIEKFKNVNETDSKNILVLLDNSNYIIGKHNDGICFVVRSKGGQRKKYKNGEMSISLNSSYLLNKKQGEYSVIFYRNHDERKIKIFVETMMNCVKEEKVDSESLFQIYSDISDVFKSIPFDYKAYIGTFGELLFIKYVFDLIKINMVSYYESTTKHLVDFKFNDLVFEIKTTSSNDRKHIINNEQLRGNGFLCSIRIAEDNSGTSILELFQSIKPLFDKNPIRLSYIENYLLSVPPKQLSEKFNVNYENIRLYNFALIPKFENYHESISNIKFTINLTSFDSFDIKKILIK